MPESFLNFNPSWTLTWAFVLFLIAGTLLRIWLARRQVRHVTLHRNQVPPLFAQSITLSAHQKAADYTVAKTRMSLVEMALGSAVLLAWTLLGGLSALNLTLLSFLGPGMAQQIALLASFVVISGLIDMPLALYQTFVIEDRFGFNKMTFRLWFIDLIRSSAIGTLVGLPIAALILWLMGAAGNQWWLWAWGVWIGFNLLLLLIYPTLIAPLFNKFAPLDDETLKARVTALMQRCGFAANGLFVMDGSKRSAHANAYFTGFGAAKRVVFFDTLLAKLLPGEVDAVLAHELGHFKHKHIIKRIVSMFGLSLLGFALLGWLAARVWFYDGLGVQPNTDGPNDALALLLFMLTVPVFSLFVTPVFALFSRRHEFEADAYAAAQTSGADLANALLKLYVDNASTLTPDPLYVKFYYSHPAASERLARITA
ncbi:MAG: M48 family metallopeptidase [Rhodoferax sp.]